MIAHVEKRIKFMMEHYNINRKQAQIVVEKQNKRRLTLYRYFARTDYDQPEHYHMVLNMNLLKLDDAVQAVCQLVGGQIPS